MGTMRLLIFVRLLDSLNIILNIYFFRQKTLQYSISSSYHSVVSVQYIWHLELERCNYMYPKYLDALSSHLTSKHMDGNISLADWYSQAAMMMQASDARMLIVWLITTRISLYSYIKFKHTNYILCKTHSCDMCASIASIICIYT